MRQDHNVTAKVAQALRDTDLISFEELERIVEKKGNQIFIPYDGCVFQAPTLWQHVAEVLACADLNNILNLQTHYSGFSNGWLFNVWVRDDCE
jgi:hypothetical protein